MVGWGGGWAGVECSSETAEEAEERERLCLLLSQAAGVGGPGERNSKCGLSLALAWCSFEVKLQVKKGRKPTWTEPTSASDGFGRGRSERFSGTPKVTQQRRKMCSRPSLT